MLSKSSSRGFQPLRVRAIPQANNDTLSTNSTIALDADTGKLVWYYQHL